jgi:hypothetical protein
LAAAAFAWITIPAQTDPQQLVDFHGDVKASVATVKAASGPPARRVMARKYHSSGPARGIFAAAARCP